MTTATHPPEINSGILTSWLPLTTAYPVVQGCSSAFYVNGDVASNYVYLYDPNDAQVTFANHCLPDVVTTWWDQSVSYNPSTTISLGPFVCPLAYTAAYSEIVDQSSNLTAFCPSGFAFRGVCSQGDLCQCGSYLSSGMSLTYYRPDPIITGDYITTTTIITTAINFQGVQVNGYNFAGQVTTTSAASSVSSISSAPSISSPLTSSIQTMSTNSSAHLSSSKKSGSSLPTSAIAAISIGATLSVIGVICLLAAILYVRRHSTKNRHTITGDFRPQAPVEMDAHRPVRELPGAGVKPGWQRHEIDLGR